MRSLLNPRWRVAVLVAACLAVVVTFTVRPRAAGPSASITAFDMPVIQDFNTLGSFGTSSLLPSGWALAESGTNANFSYTAGTGSGNSGDTYSFGATGSTERAFGTLLSGSLTPTIGASFTNNTGGTIRSLTIAYTGEQWRLGASGRGADRLDFQYSINATSLSNGAWVDVNALDFSSPTTMGTAGPLDGNGAANRSTISYTITSLNIPDGATFWIRWTDYNVISSDDGLAIDDFSLVAPTSNDPGGIGAANPSTVEVGASTLLTVAVTPGTNPPSTGLGVTADLSSIGGDPSQAFFDDGSNGDAGAGDNVFSYNATVKSGTAAGPKSLTATISDGETRHTSAIIALTVVPPVSAIHDIQGDGGRSPLEGQVVRTQGVVTAVRTVGSKGFFIQAPDLAADANPLTSEGIFVYTGSTPPPAATVGNMVEVTGTVQEYQSATEISDSPVVTVLSTGNEVPAAVELTPVQTDPAGPIDYLERYEGMRVSVGSLTVVSPTGGSTTSDGLFYGVITGLSRPFRGPGLDPLAPAIAGMPAAAPRWDGNPERLQVDSDALGGTALTVTPGAIVTGLVGPLDVSSNWYTVDPETTLTVTPGNMSAIPVPEVPAGQFTIASFNMWNFTNTPTKLSKASLVIRDVMRMPDIIGVEEMKDLPTLQALAARINADAGSPSPNYTPYLVAGNNSSGQEIGFLVRSSVTVSSVTQEGKDATFIDPRSGTSATLNDRPPLVLRGTVADPLGGEPFPLTVIVNHLRSLIEVDSPEGTGDFARTKRQKGAEFLAGLIAQYQQNGEHVVSVGDYNAFQFNDGYVDVIGTILGAPTPADQVLLASPDFVNPDLADLIELVKPEQRYSYLENGSAQAIDHIIVSSSVLPRVAGLAYGRANADFPGIYQTDAARPERVSDHDPVVAYFTFPTADVSVGVTATPANPVLSGSSVTHTITVANGTAAGAVGVVATDTLPAGLTVTNIEAPTDWTCTTTPGTTATTVSCTAQVLDARASATLSIKATLNCLLGDSELISKVAVDATGTYDPDPSNNTKEIRTTVSNPAPNIVEASTSVDALWPVNHKMVPVDVVYTISDNCGPVPVCSLTVNSSEGTDGRGDGHTATDWEVTDDHKVLLRAERSGSNSRTYTVTISCTDSAGNTGTKDVYVTVPKSQGKQQ